MSNVVCRSLIIGVICLTACVYNVEEEIYPQTGCQTDNMSYASDINPIIENTCFPCHDSANNDGNVTLEGYSQIKVHIDNGRVIGSITHSPGFAAMPQAKPKLLDCQIEKIESWIDDGALNN